MVNDRVIIEILTTAQTAGIEQAKAGFIGLTALTTAATIGIGLVAKATESIISITEEREKAEKNLSQALQATGKNQAAAQRFITDFIATNDRYVSNQADVITSYAELTRSGLTQAETQKDINRAVDIAALKNISLDDATQLLIAAEHGRMKGLIDLGISTTKYTDANGNLVKGSKDVQKAFAEIDKKTKDGRKSLTELEQSEDHLSNQWQALAKQDGPALVSALDTILGKVSDLMTAMSNSDKGPDSGWGHFQNGLIYWLQLAGDAIKKLGDLGQAWNDLVNQVTGSTGDPSTQHGGYVPSRGNPGKGNQPPSYNLPGATSAGPGGREGGGTAQATGKGGAYSTGGRRGGMQSFAGGGTVQGPYPGAPMIVEAHAGEHISKASGGGHTIILQIGTLIGADGPGMDRLAREILKRARFAPGT